MTRGPDRLDEVRTLLEALCEETITPEQMARLEGLILADPAAEAFYIEFMHMQAGFLREFGGASPGLGEAGAGPASPAGPPGPAAALGPAPPPGRRPSSRRPWLPWTIAAAACLVSLLVTGLAMRRPGDAPPRPQPPTASATPREGPAVGDRRGIAPAAGLALLIKLDGARWGAEDGPPPREGDILPARRLRLASGRATLAFLSGVMLTLEGPADVDLVTIDRVFFRRGRLRARVPEGAEGFVVSGPGSAVVDLGTEFALNVEASGRSQVMVFEGSAEAALLDEEGSPKQTQLVVRSEAYELDPRAGRIAEAVARPEGFVPAPDLGAPSLVPDPSYAAAVLRSRPKGYWRFESAADGAVPNEVPGGPPLRVSGPVEVAASRPGRGCAVFRAGAPEQFLTTDGLWELAREPGHAVELWFLSEGIHYSSLVGLFPPKDYLPPGRHGRHVHTFLVELTARDRRSLFKPASIRFLHRWPLDTRVGNNIFSEDLYIPRRWHHLVAQKNDGRVELFLDGEPDHAMPLDPDHPTLSCRLVVGRRTPDPSEAHDSRSFVGRLDELAIYDHPLTAEEVRTHFRLATPEASPE
jgi:hypothetical protein